MTTEERIQSALKKARENDANNRDARRLPSSSAGGAGASTDRAQQALAAARQKDKTTTRVLTPSRTPSSAPSSPLPSFATGAGSNIVESVRGRFAGRGGIEAIKSPDNWSSTGDAELGLKAWSGQLDDYEKSLNELSGKISNAENRLKALGTTATTTADAAAYETLYDEYSKMIDEYNGVIGDYNRAKDKYEAGITQYRNILSGGMERADAAAAEAKRLEEENSRLQRQAELIRISEMSGSSQSSAAAPLEAQIERNARRIKELGAEEAANKMQYYSSLELMDDYGELSAPARGLDDERYAYINDIDNARYRNEHTKDPSAEPVALRRYQYLTDEERQVYNYLYATQGKEAADRFLEDLRDTLATRQGTAQYERLGALGKALYWIPAGLEQFGSGLRQLFRDDALPASPTLITSQLIQQEAQEKSPVLGTLYELGTTLSNMAPSILASALGSWALGAAGLSAGTAAAVGRATGAATLGASAGGNAYTQKLNEGYGPEAARSYSMLVGASEGALQYLLGGIGALSKNGAGRVAAKIAGLDNALGRVARTVSGSTAARLLGSMISEGTEEGLQELLEPAFAAIIFDEEYEADFEDAAYAFLLGALSAGIIEGPAAIAYARRPAGFSFRDMDGYADNGVDYFEGANTLEEVEARYRDLARQYHPDVGGDTAIMAEINRQRTMARAFFRGRAEAAAADEAADTTPEAAANTERADGVIRRLTAGRTTEETAPETAGAQIEDQPYAEAGGIVLPTADTAGDFSPRAETGATETPTLEAPRAAAPETNAAGNIVLPTADEIMNGGIQNGQQEGQRPAALGGDGGRNADISAGGQAGRLGGSAEVRTAPAEQGRAALARQNSARDLRLQEVSSAELGIPEGTDTRNVRVLPETDWDDALISTAEQVRGVTGREVRYVLGSIEVRTTAGETRRVRGVWQPSGDIIIQADNLRVSPQQIADHEIYHELAAQNPGLDADVQARIREQFTEEEFGRVVESYIQKLHGIVDLPANASESEFEAALARIKQEIFADAYAGINAFGAHAERFADPTRETVKERTGIRSRENDDAVRDRTGPPAERYSYAGTNAANADLEALEVAKGMAEQNVSAETIRQATGWFQGADGKWRFEIDDSGMRYSSRGDLNYGDPDYWRYRELRDKLERDMLGIGSEAVTEAERAELGNAERQYDAGEFIPVKNRFSLNEPVEETSDLLALHNLTEDKLLNTLKLGGFPMPSIAVIRDQMPYEEFGDITMVFGRDTIDPQVNSGNRIYGGDAWTPTFPQVDYKVNEDELNRIEREVDDLVGGRDIRRQLDRTHSLDVTNVTDDLNRYNGDLATAYRYSNALKYAYLRQLNADYSLPYRYAPLGARSNMDDEIIIQLADMFGIDAIRQMREGGYRYYDSHKEELEKILDLVNQHYRETYNLDENLYDEIPFNKWDSLTADIYSYLRQGPKISVDTDAVSKFLADNVNQTEYENWVTNLFDSIVAKRGIRNSKDIFTPSGKRRNFEALHYELTLENVVKAMKNAAQKGGGAVLGGKSIWGVATKDYASVDALKQDKSRLQNIPDEKYQEQRQKFTERLHDLASEIANPKANNRLIALDDATETIIEALSKRKTASGINNELRSNKTLNIKNDTAEKALELFKDISNMPVGYFEAKPQRAVPFDEVLAAVVPNDISEELRNGLAKAGIQTIEYEAGDQLDRLAKVESVEGARFSIEDNDRPVEQAISSAKTSLRQVPALFKDKNVQFGDVNIDIGGGKFDLATEFLAERGTQNLVFDPYNRGEATNRATLDFLRDGSRADTATNANVLNVIAEAPARANVILEMAKAIKPDGKAYFMVYEGDGSGVGRETSAGWQNNRKTADYVDEIKRYFDSVERRGKLIIASNPKADLPKALWEVQPGDAVRYSAADDEPRPVIAKQDLRRRLLDTFSVPPGSRAELGRIIEGFADKMIRSGRYTEQDRSALFDKLYDAGAMTLTADPYYSDARGALVKRRMYVSDALKAEFGDDWNDFRKRAFAAGIYLTNNSNDMAPDMWQAELSETLPGLFDAGNLDMRSIIERVVQVAEEGRNEQVSLAEYTQMLANENYVSEDEVLQDLEQRVDWELRSFAEKADLEVRLRGRGADGISNTERKRIIQEERANYWQLHKQYQEETRQRIAEERGKRHASEREAREKINNIIREEREKYWQKRRDYQQRADERVRQEREKRWAAQAETRRRIDDVEQAERRTYYERLERYKEGRRATDARERERRKAMSERRRETAELRNLQQRTLKQIQWLAKNQYRAPAELKQQWNEVLGDLDIFAVSAANEMNYSKKYDATWRDIAEMYKKARDTDPNFLPSQELERIVARLDNEKIGDLDIGALQDLYKAAVGLRQEFYNRNHVIGDEEARLFSELYADSKEEINSAPGGYSKNPADKVFNLEQLTPMNYLERMAGWNPDSAWYSMAKQLEAGERNERAYIVQANALLADWLEDNEEWVLRSDGQGKDAVWYEVEVPELLELGMGDKPVFGDSVKVWMTPSMKVHLYLESKNYDNLRHMVGGRTFPDKELYSDGKRQEAFAQGRTIRLAPETVRKMVSDLTPEERELAALLERYYNQFAAERINKVSNALYGYDRAVTKNYAPIYTNSNYNQKEIGKFDQTAEGVGNLKQRIRGAKNPSYNLSAYDAFERHVDQTARFVGMAIPARNWKTLLNWRERNDSMSDVITHKWGNESLKYITDLLTDLQGGSPRKAQFQISSFADKLWSNYISAVFGANPSIVLKQLGSIPLGGAYLGMENVPTPRQMANIDRDLIALYTSELDWRLMGYATPETKQLKDHPNWTQRNSFFRNVFGGGAITGMDGWAASTLWPWAENKVRRERPELEVGTEEQVNAGQSPFYRAVAAEFDNAVNRSQSMSDTLHNARIRKADNAILRTLTMFKSDAAQTYNAFRQTIGEAQYYKRTGASSKTQRTARAAMGAAFLAWIVNAAWTAGVNFLVNLAKTKGKNYRDDEDELTAESVLGKMATDMISGMSGVVILGEELAGALGSAVTGERWYGLDAPGIEQLNDTLESIINSSKSLKKLLTDAVNIGRQGGDVLAYLNSHRADIIGGIKDVAATAVTYFPGLPVNNVEAYLAGLISWALPSVGTAYEDLFETPEKADLSGLEGDALVTRVTDILGGRLDDVSEKAAEDIATLYAAGYSEALPAGVPTQITVTDKDTDTSETVELDAYQRQFFERVWTETVGRAVDDLVAMPEYEQASPDEQVKMLNQIYRFANETAKAETIEKYSPPSTIAEAAEDIADGRTLAEWAAYDVLSDDVSGTFGKLTDEGLGYEQALDVAETVNELGDDSTAVERYLAVAQMPIPEDEKELALRGIMTDSAYSKYETARAAGIDTLDYCEFLDRISDISGDGRQERVWALIDSMRLTNRQKDVLHLAAGYKDSTLSKTPWHN